MNRDSVGPLDEVGHIIGHFGYSCMVEVLNVLQGSLVSFGYKVDSNPLTAETTTSTNSETNKKSVYDIVQFLLF